MFKKQEPKLIRVYEVNGVVYEDYEVHSLRMLAEKGKQEYIDKVVKSINCDDSK